jgi:hypothetical protein
VKSRILRERFGGENLGLSSDVDENYSVVEHVVVLPVVNIVLWDMLLCCLW